jgi:hypothetical protein
LTRGPQRHLRFGAEDGVRFSQYWKVSATARRPELVISGNQTGSFLHLTMHEDEPYWHIRVTLPDEDITTPWQPPVDVLPGVRRLVRLLIPNEAVRFPRPARADRVTWYPAPPDDQTWVEFTLLHCRQGRLAIRNADLLGGVRLVDGSEGLVIARHSPAQPGSATMAVPNREEALREFGRPLGALLHGTDTDGCLWFLNLFSTPRDEEARPPASGDIGAR